MAPVSVSKAADTISVEGEHKLTSVQHLENSAPVGVLQKDADPLNDVSTKEQASIYRKVDWRLTPMLMLLYFFANLDRAGFFPGAVFIISQWYPPHLTQVRVAFFYGAAAVSGAFSGLLAAAIAKMDGLGGYEAWRWIFIIEGLMTVILGLCCFFILPDSPSLSGRWLSEDEIRFLNWMHEKHRGVRRQPTTKPEKKEKFQWQVLLTVLSDWQIYLQSLIFISSAVPNYALKFTMPQIILNMGFTSTQAQVLTAPPYICGAISAVVSSLLADRFTWRLPFIVAPQVVLVVAYSALFKLSGDIRGNVAACYFCVHLSTIGTYPIVPGANTWTLNNLAGPTKRAVGIALMIAMGSVGGIIGSLIFQEREKPSYPTGWGNCLAFVLAGIAAALTLEASYHFINKKRARQSDEDIRERYTEDVLEKIGDRSPLFRYSL
ncbi:hypothetical protein Daus18300_011331 [Diaporthe australafricana]|uniref:Major facilitator superfamily (MFS) profile domain-containing protein n=1 Tax=Diaporthe australafricana TaxID=127596 RepID=A0ABR3W6V4_9PEZI